MRAYYNAHQSDGRRELCLNLIIATSQAAAQTIHDQIAAGATFATASQGSGVDTDSPAGGRGPVSIPPTSSSQLGQTAATAVEGLADGQIAAPQGVTVPDQSTGQTDTVWIVVGVRQHQLVSFAQTESGLRQEMLAAGGASLTACWDVWCATPVSSSTPATGHGAATAASPPPRRPTAAFVLNSGRRPVLERVDSRASPPADRSVGMSEPRGAGRPRVTVVGLGPAGPELVPAAALDALRDASRCLVRTARHPSAAVVAGVATGPVEHFDRLYEGADTFDDVYRRIVEEVVAAATTVAAPGYVAYAVPGSPLVAERTVALLRDDPRVSVEVVPAMSFLELAWARLGVDPVDAGVRLVDGTAFAIEAAGERGPLLVAQCHGRGRAGRGEAGRRRRLGPRPRARAVLLHHLGLPDEQVVEVPWADIDRTLEADHLTALWVPRLAAPVAAELVGLEELVRTLRAGCPWDRDQTHGSLGRHLLEEAYEVLDAIEVVAAAEPDVSPPMSPIWRRSSATCSSRCTSTRCWRPRRAVSRSPTWPGRCTTSWSCAIRMSSGTPWPTPPRTWRRAGRCSRRPKRAVPA